MSSKLLNKKIEYWEHQLLDLGKRNKMINYRETKRSTLKLIEPSFEELFQRIAINEETLTFQRAVDRENDIRVFSILLPETATVTVFSPTSKAGKLSSDKSGRPFRSVSPFVSTTFAVMRAESMTSVSPAESFPTIFNSLSFVVIVMYVSVPEGITPVSEYTGRE